MTERPDFNLTMPSAQKSYEPFDVEKYVEKDLNGPPLCVFEFFNHARISAHPLMQIEGVDQV